MLQEPLINYPSNNTSRKVSKATTGSSLSRNSKTITSTSSAQKFKSDATSVSETISELTKVTGVDKVYAIVLFVSGSRSDIMPFIALALHFQSIGHNVAIATEDRLRTIVEEYQIPYRRLVGDHCGAFFQPEMQMALKEGNLNKISKLMTVPNEKYSKDSIFASYINASLHADAIITSEATMLPSFCIAEKLEIPWIPVLLHGILPTSEFPLRYNDNAGLSCSCNSYKTSYDNFYSNKWKRESLYINHWRRTVLSKINRSC